MRRTRKNYYKKINCTLFVYLSWDGGGGISSGLHTLQRLHVNFVKIDPVVLKKKDVNGRSKTDEHESQTVEISIT